MYSTYPGFDLSDDINLTGLALEFVVMRSSNLELPYASFLPAENLLLLKKRQFEN
jgi:hypothetical protein